MFTFSSCVPSSGTRSAKSKTTGAVGTPDNESSLLNDPTFNINVNYFENGSEVITSNALFPINFDNEINLRGKQIHNFVRDNPTEYCLIAKFPINTGTRFFIAHLNIESKLNGANNSKEYYLSFNPGPTRSATNQGKCETISILTIIANIESTYVARAYDFQSLCPNSTVCNTSLISSDQIYVFSASGQELTGQFGHLNFELTAPEGQEDTPIGSSCTLDSQCNATYDCCSENRCVQHGAVKAEVDTSSSEYLQAIADVTNQDGTINFEKLSEYNSIFYFCPNKYIPPDDPYEPENPDTDDYEMSVSKERLYTCTNPIAGEGEKSICAVIYKNIKTSGQTSFNTPNGDKNFCYSYSGTILSPQCNSLKGLPTVHKIIYGGQVLYENGEKTGIGSFDISDAVDDYTAPTVISNFNVPLTNSDVEDKLEIEYYADGSCTKINNSLATCKKTYIQGKNEGTSEDHYPGDNQDFIIPESYNEAEQNISVEVNGVKRYINVHFEVAQNTEGKYVIRFFSSSKVGMGRKVIISYRVDTNSSKKDLVAPKFEAMATISSNSFCNCSTDECQLIPKIDESGKTVDYLCDYPDIVFGSVPLQQTIYLSTKTVPHLFFDKSGNFESEINIDTQAQEDSSINPPDPQSPRKFYYVDGNKYKPNNVDNYVGFHEIYGTLEYKTGSARPAKMLKVTKGKTYDIVTSNGQFSPCANCGVDYYSSISKLFPNNFANKGGGYVPVTNLFDRFNSKDYRSDDLIFGRACFVPATMIPWTHKHDRNLVDQRRNRLQAQHFLFANGYQRDWYGFDYGSLIGSFDGLSWFSIGNNRRITAKTNRLFLAVNSFMGDLTSEGAYTVIVTESSSIFNSGSAIRSDMESDGAECRKLHLCEVDSDCVTKLGWEYSCADVSQMQTKWPAFDDNGEEITETTETRYLKDLFGLTGSVKRCVYRGRGSACHEKYDKPSATSYSMTDKLALHSCSSDTYCQSIGLADEQAKFNTKIARFPYSVAAQNSSPYISENDLNTFGKGARYILRPYKYNGTDLAPDIASTSLNNNRINSICVPGRNPFADALTFINSNSAQPPPVGTSTETDYGGDQVLAMGVTPNNASVAQQSYLSQCSIMDEDGNFLRNRSDFKDKFLSDESVRILAGSQSISTNALKLLEDITGQTLIQNFRVNQILTPTLEQGRCLRVPGSICHTNLDCSPSSFLKNKLNNLPNESSLLNSQELQYWKEELVCGNHNPIDHADFKIEENKCCREIGKTITIPTSKNTIVPEVYSDKVGGIDFAYSDPKRNTRMQVIYSLIKSEPLEYPPLVVAQDNECGASSLSCNSIDEKDRKQNNSFQEIASRTCCSQDWVREWSEENGQSDKVWKPEKFQNINVNGFECLNWLRCDPLVEQCAESVEPENDNKKFTCAHTQDLSDPRCMAKNYITPNDNSDSKLTLEWLGSLELTGIPQVRIKSADFSETQCITHPNYQFITVRDEDNYNYVAGTTRTESEYTIKRSAIAEYEDPKVKKKYYKASDMTNFGDGIKQVFSPDKVRCCIKAGDELPEGGNNDSCCTGLAVENKCVFNDYTNLSVYFNRYVSSIGKDIDDNLYDQETGFIKSEYNNKIINFASDKGLCASGKIAYGLVINKNVVPGVAEGSQSGNKVCRYLDKNSTADDITGALALYKAGLKWNVHLYCVPESLKLDTEILCSPAIP